MSDIPSISTVLNTAKVAQYLAANDVSSQLYRKGTILNEAIAKQIYATRKAVQWMFDRNPSEPTLRQTANFLWAILDKYQKQATDVLTSVLMAPPTVTGPSDATVIEGQTATFGIVVTSLLPHTTQWFKGGVVIPGATSDTYSFTATLADNGTTYRALVDNGAGQAQSAIGHLAVGAVLQGQYYYGTNDYYTALSGGTDNITYNGFFNIVDQQPLSVPFPAGAANNKFLVVRYPATQGPKTSWFNTPLNNGPSIPDQVYREIVTIGSNLYLITRTDVSTDTSQPIIYS